MKTLEQLLADWDNGTLSAEDAADLKRLLASPEARAELVGDCLLHGAIYERLREERTAQEAVEPQLALSPAVKRPISRPSINAAFSTAEKVGPSPGFRREFLPRLVWRDVQISLRWALGAAVAVVLGLVGFHFYSKTRAVAYIAKANGPVVVERASKRITATAGTPLRSGDLIRVALKQSAVVAWAKESTEIRLEADTDLLLLSQARGKQATLRHGRLRALVSPQPRKKPMILFTPEAEVKVVGTDFTLGSRGAATRLELLAGAVEVRRRPAQAEPPVTLRAGQMCVITRDAAPVVQWLTGSVTRELWLVPAGTVLADVASRGSLLNRTSVISMASLSSNAKAGSKDTDIRVVRNRGYVIAPRTGDYTFWLAIGEGPAELWLSPDDDPAKKARIAHVTKRAPASVTSPRSTNGQMTMRAGSGGRIVWRSAVEFDWNKSPTQKSPPQSLIAGRRYYFEVLHYEAAWDYLQIGWLQPGEPITSRPKVIHATNVCPFIEYSSLASNSGVIRR